MGWFSQDKEVAQAVAAQLEKLGVKTNMRAGARLAFWDYYVNGRSDGLFLLGCGNQIGTFEYCARLHFHSKFRGMYYNTPELDSLLDKVSAALAPEDRAKAASAGQQVLVDEAPVIVGYEDLQIFAHKKALRWQGFPHERIDMREARWE